MVEEAIREDAMPERAIPDAAALEARLRAIGAECYHDKHPFHALMREGSLDKGQVQAWALNRYYYQSRIPIKDAVIMSRLLDPELRRIWSQRVIDHDGSREGRGGLARWLQLCEGLGLARDYVVSEQGILPATKFAVDAYVHFVRERSLLEAIASSLTELFSPGIIRERVSAMLAQYDFVDEAMLAYFSNRLVQAPRDADFALDYVKTHAATPALREAVCQALRFKTDVLWAQLDALYFAYVEPRLTPPGAFLPEARKGQAR
jgi:coenzyme PQQ biosynthesis protein C